MMGSAKRWLATGPFAVVLLCAGAAMATSTTAVDTTAGDIPDFMVVEGDTLWLTEPLEIVGTRVPAALPALVRGVDMLSASEVADLPARSAAEQLQFSPAVTVNQRQQYGIQSDLTVRGSTFEQVQVLFDGMDLGDPQTGHHLLNLPLARNDIQRLEILPGHGSALYGSGAFGGTVNVVPRMPGSQHGGGSGGRVELFGGGNGTWGGDASVDLVKRRQGTHHSGARLSVSRFKTDGYDVRQPDGTDAWGNNDAESWTATGAFTHRADFGQADLYAGWSERAFGAPDFYAPYPSWERTRTFFAAGSYTRDLSDRVTLRPRVYYRRHDDRFVLLRNNPEAYTNDHLTNKIGGELRGVVDVGSSYLLAASLEAMYEDIDSQGVRGGIDGPALGEHLRRRLSAAVEIDRIAGRFLWQAGLRIDRRTGQDWRLAGSGAVSYELNEVLTARASAGNVLRAPTFTELYYRDPVNRGNPRLDAETGWAWDAGLELEDGPWQARLAYFERYENHLIEWARMTGDAIWQVMNVADGTVRGVEVAEDLHLSGGHSVGVSYAGFLKHTTLPDGYEGKYALLTPRHQAALRGTAALPWRLTCTVTGRYREHPEGPEDFRHSFVVDARLGWTGPQRWFASVTGTNLFDRRYEEVPGVQMPGLLVTAAAGKAF